MCLESKETDFSQFYGRQLWKSYTEKQKKKKKKIWCKPKKTG